MRALDPGAGVSQPSERPDVADCRAVHRASVVGDRMRVGDEARVVHAEWEKDPLVGEAIERHAGDSLDDVLQDDHVPVAVHGGRSRGGTHRARVDVFQELRASAVLQVEGRAGFESSAVREQHARRDRGLVGRVEFGEIGVHRPVEVEPVLLLEDHGERRAFECRDWCDMRWRHHHDRARSR
jgi:hypothetical protein